MLQSPHIRLDRRVQIISIFYRPQPDARALQERGACSSAARLMGGLFNRGDIEGRRHIPPQRKSLTLSREAQRCSNFRRNPRRTK